jgi:hypothetical protein
LGASVLLVAAVLQQQQMFSQLGSISSTSSSSKYLDKLRATLVETAAVLEQQ